MAARAATTSERLTKGVLKMSDIIETIKHKGFSIDILPDYSPENPWQSWDCMPPMVAYGGRNELSEYGLTLSAPELSREEVADNIAALKEALDWKGGLLSFCREYAYHYLSAYYSAIDCLNDAIEQYGESLSTTDRLEFLVDLYRIKGWPVVCVSRTGYAQGAWLELLLVATPDYCEEIGTKPTPESLENEADVYASWVFGDVFGYQVEELDESCWGFYGDDHEKSGLLEYARSAIDCHIEHQRRERLKKVKTWIKNRVPFYARVGGAI